MGLCESVLKIFVWPAVEKCIDSGFYDQYAPIFGIQGVPRKMVGCMKYSFKYEYTSFMEG